MKFDDILLALIARRARSGYDLKKWLDVEGIFLRANADSSQIYRTLRRLQKQELITFDVVRKGGPDAKIYRPTEAGVAHLRALATTPYEPPARREEPGFGARLALLGPIEPSTILPTIDRELAFRREQVRRFRHRPRPSDVAPGPIDIDPALVDTINRQLDRIGQDGMDRWIAWLEEQRALWEGILAQRTADSEDSTAAS